ncbi:ankyrin repeat domain-containing protein 61-like [Genypterus blacodes]|uniref:ankyrin repeat domain-containing protein 61-like n=1 Tax=Genypterus blacodes TaxID=154954 RepID=UPI003F7777DF
MSEESKEVEDSAASSAKFQNNELCNAIMDEDLERIEELLKQHGSNFLIKIQDGVPGKLCKGISIPALHLAACYRKVKSMQSLLSAGADPERRDQLGQTTLHFVISDWPRLQDYLATPGSKLRVAVSYMKQQAEACLRLLCEHGVHVNAEVEGERQTALHLSVQHRALPAIQILTSCGADVNAVDSAGMTALHMACGILHKDIITSLIKKGAHINMGVKHSGNTPLHMAALAIAMKTTKAEDRDISCLTELLEQGVEPDAVNEAGATPLHDACSAGNEALVDLLLSYGADINKLNQAGENALFLFLNRLPNVTHSSLLLKLLSLTSPLTIYNHSGQLPSTLTLSCFYKQRDQLLKLAQQPRRLQDMCKTQIYLKYGKDRREMSKKMPESIYCFVFNSWENLHGISFMTDTGTESLNSLSDTAQS